MADDIMRMPISDFREKGYLQELNRRFLHPLGLAMEVEIGEDGIERLGGVWDYRADAEGMRYQNYPAGSVTSRAEAIDREWDAKARVREQILGYVIQPPEDCEVKP